MATVAALASRVRLEGSMVGMKRKVICEPVRAQRPDDSIAVAASVPISHSLVGCNATRGGPRGRVRYRIYAPAHLRTVSTVRVVMSMPKVRSSRAMNTGPFAPGT